MKIKVVVDWPWAGIEPDTAEIEVEDDLDDTEIELIARDAAEDVIFDRADYSWEVIR